MARYAVLLLVFVGLCLCTASAGEARRASTGTLSGSEAQLGSQRHHAASSRKLQQHSWQEDGAQADPARGHREDTGARSLTPTAAGALTRSLKQQALTRGGEAAEIEREIETQEQQVNAGRNQSNS